MHSPLPRKLRVIHADVVGLKDELVESSNIYCGTPLPSRKIVPEEFSKLTEKNDVDIAGLKKELVESIKTYGYTPLQGQKHAIEQFSKGKNVIMQGVCNSKTTDGRLQGTYIRGKIATYCLAILNQLDLSSADKCEGLIVTSDSDYINEIVSDMQKLGGNEVKVAPIDDLFVDECSACAHVAVGGIPNLMALFSDAKFCLPDLKMLVFDWGYTYLSFNQTIYCTQWVYKNLIERSPPKDCQFAIFSECEVPNGFNVGSEKLEIELVDCRADLKYTLDGINKHKFVSVEEDFFSCWKVVRESKVKAIFDVLADMKPNKDNLIIVVVSGYGQFDYVKEELGKRYEVDTLSEGMNLKDRDLVLQRFFNGKHLLVTRREWLRDMHPSYLRSRVGAIIYYNCREDTYMRHLGWFQNVGAAVTVVDPTEIFDLLSIQKVNKSVVFERTKPSKFRGAGKGLPKYSDQKHYLFFVGGTDNDRKREELHCLDDVLVANGDVSQTSVIYVKHPELVDVLITDLKKRFSGIDELVITSRFSDAAETMKKAGHACLFVTADCSIKMDVIKKDVYALVIYDMPVEKYDYCHLFGWCKDNGVVVHLATRLDCFEIFDIQINLGVVLEQHSVGHPESYLEETFPDVYVPEDDSEDEQMYCEEKSKRKNPPT